MIRMIKREEGREKGKEMEKKEKRNDSHKIWERRGEEV